VWRRYKAAAAAACAVAGGELVSRAAEHSRMPKRGGIRRAFVQPEVHSAEHSRMPKRGGGVASNLNDTELERG
jgi:hypothetical protein